MKSIISEKSIRTQGIGEWLANTSIRICAHESTSETVDVIADIIKNSFGSAYVRIENLLGRVTQNLYTVFSINHITLEVIINFRTYGDLGMILGYLNIVYEKSLIQYLTRSTCKVLLQNIGNYLPNIMKYKDQDSVQYLHIKKRRCIAIITQAMFIDRYKIKDVIKCLNKYENKQTLCRAYLDAAGANQSLESRFIQYQKSIHTYSKGNIDQARKRSSPTLESIQESGQLAHK